MMPCLFNAKAGSFDLDDISLVAIDPAEVPSKSKETAKKEPKVDGNRILHADGTEAWLQGASTACNGPTPVRTSSTR